MDCLLVSAGTWRCALPLSSVVETMRALPVHPCSSVPAYVRGLSVIRGAPTPVIDLAAFLAGQPGGPAGRLVTLRLAGRTIALAVDQVVGIRAIDERAAQPLRGVLTPFARQQVRALQALDAELVALFDETLMLSDELPWAALDAAGRAL